MNCPTCGKDNPKDARFCGVCGANLISSETSVGTELPMVGFAEAVSRGFREYFTFDGRATRAEYWWWVLFFFVALIGVSIIDAFLTSGILFFLFWFGVIIPHVAVTVRRLHDINMTGWWFLISLIPFFGLVLFLICAQAGKMGTNKYGPDPRQATSQQPYKP